MTRTEEVIKSKTDKELFVMAIGQAKYVDIFNLYDMLMDGEIDNDEFIEEVGVVIDN